MATAQATGKWRIGDAGTTIFGPKIGERFPEVVASKLSRENARKIIKAVNCHDELLDALAMALPYVEMAEHDDAYKPGAVANMVRQMREAIASAE